MDDPTFDVSTDDHIESAQAPVDGVRKKWSTRKTILIIASIVFVVILAIRIIILILGFFAVSTSPSESDYKSYLENKYGVSEGFSYTGEYGNCSTFDGGFCEKIFTSKESGQKFKVTYFTYGKYYTDQYWLAKNYKELNSHYRDIISEFFHYNYSLSFSGELADHDIEPYVTAQDLLNNDGFSLDIKINTRYVDIPDFDDFDKDYMEYSLRNLADNGTIPEVDQISLEIDMRGSGRTGYCPTSGTGGGGDNRILTCFETLYTK